MAGETISFGRVFGRAFGTIGRNPLVVLGLAFVCSALPAFILRFLTSGIRPAFANGDARPLLFLVTVGGWLLSFVGNALVQGALVRVVLAEDEGRRATFVASLMSTLPLVLPLVAVGILTGLGVMLGMMVLIIPGIILILRWSVVVPVVIAERTGVSEAFGRSRELTEGARWKILGLFLVVAAIMFMVAVVGVVIAMSMGANPDGADDGFNPVTSIVTLIMNTTVSAIGAMLAASLYIELRNWKDGPQTRALGEIFA